MLRCVCCDDFTTSKAGIIHKSIHGLEKVLVVGVCSTYGSCGITVVFVTVGVILWLNLVFCAVIDGMSLFAFWAGVLVFPGPVLTISTLCVEWCAVASWDVVFMVGTKKTVLACSVGIAC